MYYISIDSCIEIYMNETAIYMNETAIATLSHILLYFFFCTSLTGGMGIRSKNVKNYSQIYIYIRINTHISPLNSSSQFFTEFPFHQSLFFI
jgi:hypothetical protein